jgi:8-amino-7-oxononanoate synthase
MAFSLFSREKKAIAARCADDFATKMRLKYAPYYRAMEAQRGTCVRHEGRDLVMLASNDYLGLSFHPAVIAAAQQAIARWGTSPTGARSSNGSRAYHESLEDKLAAFLGREACHVHSAGYLSCMAAVAAFATKGDMIFADKNIHSCLWDGIRLSTATVERFAHNSAEDFRAVAATAPADVAKMLVVEGVYSMEGHIGELPGLLAVAEEHHCFNVLDDAHGFGVLGREGRGTADHFGVADKIDILAGSLSKSLGSTGGFVAGSRNSIEYLRTNSKHTIFSAALSPAQAAAAEKALEIMQTEPQHRERLWANTRRYTAMLHSLKLDTWGSETPAVPIVVGSKERAYRFWQLLLEKGVFTVMSIVPAVPPGKDLIRTAISALHSDEDLGRIEDAFAYAVKKL